MESREAFGRRSRQERLDQAQDSLTKEREAHTWLIEKGLDGAARRMQENITKIEKHVERCRLDLN